MVLFPQWSHVSAALDVTVISTVSKLTLQSMSTFPPRLALLLWGKERRGMDLSFCGSDVHSSIVESLSGWSNRPVEASRNMSSAGPVIGHMPPYGSG